MLQAAKHKLALESAVDHLSDLAPQERVGAWRGGRVLRRRVLRLGDLTLTGSVRIHGKGLPAVLLQPSNDKDRIRRPLVLREKI